MLNFLRLLPTQKQGLHSGYADIVKGAESSQSFRVGHGPVLTKFKFISLS